MLSDNTGPAETNLGSGITTYHSYSVRHRVINNVEYVMFPYRGRRGSGFMVMHPGAVKEMSKATTKMVKWNFMFGKTKSNTAFKSS